MVKKTCFSKLAKTAICGFLALVLWVPGMARVHCDTMDGPVVAAAQD